MELGDSQDRGKKTNGCFWSAVAVIFLAALAIWGILSLDSTPQDEVAAEREAGEEPQ